MNNQINPKVIEILIENFRLKSNEFRMIAQRLEVPSASGLKEFDEFLKHRNIGKSEAFHEAAEVLKSTLG